MFIFVNLFLFICITNFIFQFSNHPNNNIRIQNEEIKRELNSTNSINKSDNNTSNDGDFINHNDIQINYNDNDNTD